MVQEEESGSTLTGLSALFALFHHAHVYEHISLILTCFHPHPTVRSAAQMTADLHDDGIPGTGISPIPVVSSTPGEFAHRCYRGEFASNRKRRVSFPELFSLYRLNERDCSKQDERAHTDQHSKPISCFLSFQQGTNLSY